MKTFVIKPETENIDTVIEKMGKILLTLHGRTMYAESSYDDNKERSLHRRLRDISIGIEGVMNEVYLLSLKTTIDLVNKISKSVTAMAENAARKDGKVVNKRNNKIKPKNRRT